MKLHILPSQLIAMDEQEKAAVCAFIQRYVEDKKKEKRQIQGQIKKQGIKKQGIKKKGR